MLFFFFLFLFDMASYRAHAYQSTPQARLAQQASHGVLCNHLVPHSLLGIEMRNAPCGLRLVLDKQSGGVIKCMFKYAANLRTHLEEISCCAIIWFCLYVNESFIY